MKIDASTRQRQLTGTASLLLMSIIWGWAFVFQKMALTANLSASALMFSRFFVAACLFGIVVAKQIKTNYKPGQWKVGLLLSVLFFAASFIQILGLQLTTPGDNALITSANVVMVPFVGWAVTRKRPSWILLACTALCFAGIAVLTLDTTRALLIAPGNALTLLAAFLFAMHLVAVGEVVTKMHFTVLAFMQFFFVAIMSFVCLLIDGMNIEGLTSKEGLVAILYMGVVATCIGLTLQMIGQRHISPTIAAILVSTESLLGALFSIIAGFDKLSWRLLIGGSIMFLSVVISNLWTNYNNLKS